MKNIVFIGGIHGVGKGTLCKEIARQSNLVHLSSSALIKWTDISSKKNKKVENINETQDRLITALSFSIEENEKYILDGHFCLLNSEGIPNNVPSETFKKIEPRGLIVVIENIDTISQRLNSRDNIYYSLKSLENFQQREVKRAFEISKKLGVPCLKYNGDFEQVKKFIDSIL